MKNTLSIIILTLFLSSHFMFSQYDSQAYSIHEGKFQVEKETFVTSFIIFHSFDKDEFIAELEKEFGDFKKADTEETVFNSYSSSKVNYKKWSSVPFAIHIKSKHGTVNEINTKLYFNGKWVDAPRKTTIFYMLNEDNTDILISKKTKKKVNKYLISVIKRITNQRKK